ncbi:fluoride efflux transporter FluC [Streptomyces gobiensis]|uniref:fluoride efflux transporter FluC n=1 Tax=Streptomyces gobiensis TaxID=2875706 RepID=UPI001E3F0B20|nr:CrcB family protein [Streptomyces gobiensis]UGY92756.1 CrcB family protein [Streptomyces gobiensis]
MSAEHEAAALHGGVEHPEAIDPDVDLHVPQHRLETAGRHAWQVLAAIAVGGAVGGLGRYGLTLVWPGEGSGFPLGMFVANVLGCALIGVLMVLVSERGTPVNPLVRPFLGVGVLGGFTSFSTYAIDVSRLLDEGAAGVALAYMGGTVIAALIAVWAGAAAVRALVRRFESPSGTPGAAP